MRNRINFPASADLPPPRTGVLLESPCIASFSFLLATSPRSSLPDAVFLFCHSAIRSLTRWRTQPPYKMRLARKFRNLPYILRNEAAKFIKKERFGLVWFEKYTLSWGGRGAGRRGSARGRVLLCRQPRTPAQRCSNFRSNWENSIKRFRDNAEEMECLKYIRVKRRFVDSWTDIIECATSPENNPIWQGAGARGCSTDTCSGGGGGSKASVALSRKCEHNRAAISVFLSPNNYFGKHTRGLRKIVST